MKRHAFTSAHIVALLRAAALALCLAAPLWPAGAWAQTYPAKPIKLIVPFPAGGPADLFARSLGHGLGTELSQQIIIENRAGTGGLAGVDALAKSAPDGYTIGINGAAALSAIPFMVSKMPFDWQKDLALLTLVARVPEVVVVHPSLGINTLQELVAYARANPRKINYGSAGTGSITHLVVELLKTEAKIDLVHVPYRGAAPAVNDLLGGHVQMMFADVPVLLGSIQSGKLRALAIGSKARLASLPLVATTAELGMPQVEADNWYGLVAPIATPPAIIAKIHSAATQALNSAEVRDKLAAQGAIAVGNSAAEFSSYVKSEIERWGSVIAATGIKIK
jgi:tripartite-type tricarboxylate transporter receptor subunit TctC